jgi:hypothetical protein
LPAFHGGGNGQPAAKIVKEVHPVNKISQKKPVQLLQKKCKNNNIK